MHRTSVRLASAGVVTATLVLGGLALVGVVVDSGRPLWRQREHLAFDDLLLAGALVVVALAVGWLCLAVAVCAVAEAVPAAGDTTRRLARRMTPSCCRRLVAAAFGAAAVAGPAGTLPAVGVESPQPSRPATCAALPCRAPVSGLPLPDRPLPGVLAAHRRSSDAPARWVRVRRGDTLWSLAAERLPRRVSEADVAAAWPRWYRLNRARIGPDPHLIHPGTRLRPPSRAH
jgi:hypothetical protein